MIKLKKHVLIFLMGLSLFLTIICGFGVLYNAVEGYYSRNTFDYKETPFSRIIAYNYAQETIDYIDGWTNSYDVQSRLENNSTNANIIVYDEDDNQIYNNRQRIGSNVSEFMFNFVSHSQNYYVKVTIPRDIKIGNFGLYCFLYSFLDAIDLFY